MWNAVLEESFTDTLDCQIDKRPRSDQACTPARSKHFQTKAIVLERRQESLENTVLLEKVEGKRNRGRPNIILIDPIKEATILVCKTERGRKMTGCFRGHSFTRLNIKYSSQIGRGIINWTVYHWQSTYGTLHTVAGSAFGIASLKDLTQGIRMPWRLGERLSVKINPTDMEKSAAAVSHWGKPITRAKYLFLSVASVCEGPVWHCDALSSPRDTL